MVVCGSPVTNMEGHVFQILLDSAMKVVWDSDLLVVGRLHHAVYTGLSGNKYRCSRFTSWQHKVAMLWALN